VCWCVELVKLPSANFSSSRLSRSHAAMRGRLSFPLLCLFFCSLLEKIIIKKNFFVVAAIFVSLSLSRCSKKNENNGKSYFEKAEKTFSCVCDILAKQKKEGHADSCIDTMTFSLRRNKLSLKSDFTFVIDNERKKKRATTTRKKEPCVIAAVVVILIEKDPRMGSLMTGKWRFGII
jgi:hypothetical protein